VAVSLIPVLPGYPFIVRELAPFLSFRCVRARDLVGLLPTRAGLTLAAPILAGSKKVGAFLNDHRGCRPGALELERSVHRSDCVHNGPVPGRALFGAGLGGDKYPTRIVIYAVNPDACPLEEPSQRPFQTVIPLSRRLGFMPHRRLSSRSGARVSFRSD
jgi:hypothetical protein